MNYFIPSIQQKVNFNFLTISQLLDIQNYSNQFLFLKTGLSYSFSKAIITNCTQRINLTDFDKHALYIQIYYKEFVCNENFTLQDIKHPNNSKIKEGLYELDLSVPDVVNEIKFCEYVTTVTDKNTLLLLEVSKYINCIAVNQTQINFNIPYNQKIKILNKLPVNVLASCIKYIDNIKKLTKQLYKDNNILTPFNISLLV
jgi:hypothetical protein